MSITLGSITLPTDLHWSDEFDWTPVAQETEYTLAGALAIETGVMQAGRPITLEGGEDRAWATRATVLLLQAAAALPGEKMTLTLNDARTFVHCRTGSLETGQVYGFCNLVSLPHRQLRKL